MHLIPDWGNFRVWCTGCRHAQWALLGIPITDDHAQLPDRGFILIPMSELTIEDSWFVTGMRAVGSSTVTAENVFVPAHRYVSAFRLASGANDNPHKDEVLYRAPFISGGMIILAGLHLGLARAALDIVIGQSAKPGIAYPIDDAQRDAPAVQLAVAKAESLADMAELLACRRRGRRGRTPEGIPRLPGPCQNTDGCRAGHRQRQRGHPRAHLRPRRPGVRRDQSAPANTARQRGSKPACDSQRGVGAEVCGRASPAESSH
jgi:alkylation response protein AidB-like acyl-CoA dehydrogenase